MKFVLINRLSYAVQSILFSETVWMFLCVTNMHSFSNLTMITIIFLLIPSLGYCLDNTVNSSNTESNLFENDTSTTSHDFASNQTIEYCSTSAECVKGFHCQDNRCLSSVSSPTFIAAAGNQCEKTGN